MSGSSSRRVIEERLLLPSQIHAERETRATQTNNNNTTTTSKGAKKKKIKKKKRKERETQLKALATTPHKNRNKEPNLDKCLNKYLIWPRPVPWWMKSFLWALFYFPCCVNGGSSRHVRLIPENKPNLGDSVRKFLRWNWHSSSQQNETVSPVYLHVEVYHKTRSSHGFLYLIVSGSTATCYIIIYYSNRICVIAH
ncbi:hypothetical protein BDV27DRAFT_17112 [Aspergillus caelatus]|uniref:Uncharacterized protein n=1 Tax=Aspergillus caelatus TaxID=61420 RepID=A0A5N6ZYD8_9EURO|nr:uncharacterized protein BDV27DRAFT_17112 [Aspergillus caelatus]KAE8362542.1 hypothetical protein BDV27DRAFT_17112 [Aspergillus caelatus]